MNRLSATTAPTAASFTAPISQQTPVRNRLLRGARQAQRGISILSVLLGLAVASAAGYIIFDQFQKSQQSTVTQATVADIVSMSSAAQALYGKANQYAAVDTAVAVQGNVTGNRRVAGTNTAQNQFNGAITFAPATITIANDSLNMGYANVTREVCVDVVMQVEALMRQIQVAGTDVKPADGVINIATLSTQCNTAPRVNINFIFGRMAGV